jgi:hypothetical protein
MLKKIKEELTYETQEDEPSLWVQNLVFRCSPLPKVFSTRYLVLLGHCLIPDSPCIISMDFPDLNA